VVPATCGEESTAVLPPYDPPPGRALHGRAEHSVNVTVHHGREDD
jgi:hypothetical protein